ncbi:MAG TPA: polyprenyl synthetase family protein, partial [Actinomycetales bacterium]|nr:polyprenyl synthetase family protein [Actinomycetales bacterium]
LRDDLLDISGDPKTLGKPAGADLREGKRTVVFTIALARAQGTVRQRLLEQVGQQELTSAQVAQLSQDMAECGAVAEVEELIDSLSTTAFETLAKLHLEEPGVEVLQQLARAVVDRSA